MCWESKTKPELQTAKEDIVVYKVALLKETGIESLFQRFHYKLGCVYKMPELILLSQDCYRVKEGFHSYNTYKDAFQLCLSCGFTWILGATYYVLKCIIPKGSKYYKNAKEIVSDTIIIKDILT